MTQNEDANAGGIFSEKEMVGKVWEVCAAQSGSDEMKSRGLMRDREDRHFQFGEKAVGQT